jgi:hypothetical protein
VNKSLRRRLRGFSFAGGGVIGGSTFSRLGFLRVVRFILEDCGMERLSRRDVGRGGGALEDSEIPMSSITMSSVSESEASVSDMTRGDPTNGASRLEINWRFRGSTQMLMLFVYSFSPR